MKQWLPIQTEEQYAKVQERFEEIYTVGKDDPEFMEMKLLAMLLNDYEQKHHTLPQVDPIEAIKIRMKDFGYKPADLAKAYGDKGTVSKVLNYKQPLSLTMIRIFSKLLHIPAEALIIEYELRKG